MKVLKIVPNEFINASRDLREISTLKSLGCEVVVVAKASKRSCVIEDLPIIRLSSRPIGKYIRNATINRLISFFIWAKTIRGEKANILSCHDIICLFIGWMSTCFQTKKPYLVYDSHEFEYARDESRGAVQLFLVKHLERFLMKRCAFSMMVNDSIADEVVKLHHLEDRPVVIRNTPYYWHIDENLLAERKCVFKKQHNIPHEAPLILYQGGLVKRRGIENAIKAISQVDAAYLVIMGNGSAPYVESLYNLVTEYNIDHRVIFLPAAPYAELWKYTGMADVGLCILENVCLNHYYALPNKCLEYIQALVPVITSDFPELRRVVRKYDIGECCNADDASHLAETIRNLLSNHDLLNKYRANLRVAKEELCWEQESKILSGAYLNFCLDDEFGQQN